MGSDPGAMNAAVVIFPAMGFLLRLNGRGQVRYSAELVVVP
jgi:hypothetical protein